jgi:hypothetical protein
MKLPVIRHLAETFNLEQLRAAEDCLLNEKNPEISIEGDDEGEMLTHVLGAIDILEDMQKSGADFRTALRNYTQRVRNSIS